MELKTLQEEVRKLSEIVGGWSAAGNIPEIERDLALEKLRALYDAVRFGTPRWSAAPEAGDEAPVVVPVGIDLGEVLSLDPLPMEESDEVHVAVDEDVAEFPAAPVAEPEVDPVPQPEPDSAFDGEFQTTACEPEVPAAAPVAELPRDPEPEPEATPQTLFGIEADDTARHRHKQRVIMSLYNTEETPRPAVAAQPVTEKSPEPPTVAAGEPVAAPVAEKTAPQPVEVSAAEVEAVDEPEPVATPEPEISVDEDDDEFTIEEVTISQGAVLGEVINPNVQTLADALAPQHPVASEIRPEHVADLRRAIGINDKFLMIRDLFDNDGEAFEAAVETFNAFDNLDDCMIHIAENYAWNPNSDGAKLLVELLERKFA